MTMPNFWGDRKGKSIQYTGGGGKQDMWGQHEDLFVAIRWMVAAVRVTVHDDI